MSSLFLYMFNVRDLAKLTRRESMSSFYALDMDSRRKTKWFIAIDETCRNFSSGQ